MALIIETGSIVAGANSFISLADADAYHELRGNSAWASADDDAKVAALVNATVYVCGKYLARWKGSKLRADQPLCWPRQGVSDEDGFAISGIPERLKAATAEAALRALAGNLAPDETREVLRENIAGIDTSYRAGSPSRAYPVVDQLLAGLLKGSGVRVQLA